MELKKSTKVKSCKYRSDNCIENCRYQEFAKNILLNKIVKIDDECYMDNTARTTRFRTMPVGYDIPLMHKPMPVEYYLYVSKEEDFCELRILAEIDDSFGLENSDKYRLYNNMKSVSESIISKIRRESKK